MKKQRQMPLFSLNEDSASDTDTEGKKMGSYHPGNTLNDLTGKEWIKFTRSWFVCNPKPRKESEILHPAKFPEEMIEQFIEFFTKKGQTVLDPFLGSGSTLVACNNTLRRGYGVELSTYWAEIARKRTLTRRITEPGLSQTVIVGDSRELDKIAEQHSLPKFDFCITSPPYGNILRTSRGGVESAQRKRAKSGLPEYYSEDPRDLGNLESTEEYIDNLFLVFSKVKELLRLGSYIVVVIQNARTPEGDNAPLAWEIALRLKEIFTLKQERIWCQDNKPLGIWGYPKEYVSNVHHHYCLILKND
ncbi:MAG: DNA methyltransferase [Thermoplasmata archaeon]